MGFFSSCNVCLALLVLATTSAGQLYEAEDRLTKSFFMRSILQQAISAASETAGAAEEIESELGEEEYDAIRTVSLPRQTTLSNIYLLLKYTTRRRRGRWATPMLTFCDTMSLVRTAWRCAMMARPACSTCAWAAARTQTSEPC